MNWIIEQSPALLIALPLFFSFLSMLSGKFSKKAGKIISFTGIFSIIALILIVSETVLSTGPVSYAMGADQGVTLPSGLTLPIRIIFTIDAFSALMLLAIAIVALAAFAFSLRFIKKTEKYYGLLFILLAGMIGLASTSDLFNLFVFTEIISVSSAALIAFYRKDAKATEAAFKYLVISSLASLMLLFGVGILYGQYGALNIAVLAGLIEFSVPDIAAIALLLSALAMKCGAVPMHMWVPDAYSRAPAPVTAVLVTASLSFLYALFRLAFTLFSGFSAIALLAHFLVLLGLLSMFIGVTMALIQKDIKRLIAFHSISQIGYILLGLGIGLAVMKTPLAAHGFTAMSGSLFHLINYSLYKSLLFLAAGAVIYSTGKRNLNEISGLAKKMPALTILFIIGAASISGLPPTNGFASKLLLYQSTYLFNPLFAAIAMIVSILTLVSFLKVFCSAFLGPEIKELKTKELSFSMLIAMAMLAILIMFFGLFPETVINSIIEPAANALINQNLYVGAVL